MTAPHDHTILIVDDDADIREVLTLVLDMDGMSVIEAADGTEALARVRGNSRIALVLLDVMMPNMNGVDVLRVMKHDPELANIPVLLLSGDRHVQEIARELGADGYLGKPVDRHVLLREVHRFVDRGRS